MLREALDKAGHDRTQLAEAKAQLTLLNSEIAHRIEVETAALNKATDSLELAKAQVVKSEKFSTLGELVAGVAHEINNPIGCITSNVGVVEAYGELLKHGAISAISCYPGQVNQVFMNIIANAIDAMGEDDKPVGPREIAIITTVVKQNVVIEIVDNAGGMPEAVRLRIFESQFTIKAAEKGTGLGLSIAH